MTSLYDQLGGERAVEAAVAIFYDRVLQDPLLAPMFSQVDMDKLRKHQKEFMTYAFGGHPEYAGRSMAAAHSGLNITDEHFDAVLQHLSDTLNELKVKEMHIYVAASLVNALRAEIVQA